MTFKTAFFHHIVYLFVLLPVLNFNLASGLYTKGSVYCKSRNRCSFSPEVDTKATAYGTYNDTLLETGWGILDVVAGQDKTYHVSDTGTMFAGGFLEGVLTAKRIYQHYQNMHYLFFNGESSEFISKVKQFFSDQDKWMRKMISEQGPKDPFWRHISYIAAQFDGLYYGYKSVAPSSQMLDVFAFQVLNGNGDLFDISHVVAPDTIPNWSSMTKTQVHEYVVRHSMCSALIKVMGAYEDIFMSHSSWFMYEATMRIFKHYNFKLKDSTMAAEKISFSSYPGYLESLDDFYLMGSGMVMLQTTNSIFNTSLYQFITPDSLLAWQRVRVANAMAHTGKEWATVLAKFNSGTYNNQYMVLDLKSIELNKTIHDGALWVVEQIPTLVVSGDKTEVLRAGYWPSFNVPFFEEIYNMSGYPEMVEKHGVDMSYQLAPRNKIFRRDEGKVVDMKSMETIMRYNDYEKDPYSEDNSCNTICCRGDLMETPGPFGCYDTKVSNYKMAQEFKAEIINGPTTADGLPPFDWAKFNVSHVGLPEKYNFDFVLTKPAFP
ncbi:hypothetical protein ScPMuIL_003802 [Solemya velum]